MGKARLAGLLVLRAHVVPDVDRHDRRLAVGVDDDRQAIGQGEFLVRNQVAVWPDGWRCPRRCLRKDRDPRPGPEGPTPSDQRNAPNGPVNRVRCPNCDFLLPKSIIYSGETGVRAGRNGPIRPASVRPDLPHWTLDHVYAENLPLNYVASVLGVVTGWWSAAAIEFIMHGIKATRRTPQCHLVISSLWLLPQPSRPRSLPTPRRRHVRSGQVAGARGLSQINPDKEHLEIPGRLLVVDSDISPTARSNTCSPRTSAPNCCSRGRLRMASTLRVSLPALTRALVTPT